MNELQDEVQKANNIGQLKTAMMKIAKEVDRILYDNEGGKICD